MLAVKIRAKVKVYGKEAFEVSGGGIVKMSAVYSNDPDDENKIFTDATPSLSLSIQISKQDTFDFYQTGKEYYLDFIPVKEEKK